MRGRESHRSLTLRLLVVSGATACLVALAGCASSSPTAGSSPVSSPSREDSTAAAAPSASTIEPDGGADPYLTSNCALPTAPVASQEPPADGQTLGAVTVTYDEQQVPEVTIGPQAGPVADLETLDLVVGEGAEVKAGDVISFNYCGVGMTTRQVFDSSWARGEALTYGLDELIPGWITGLPGMKEGGQRLLVIPGDLGYGPDPNPASGILPDETLVFVVQLLAVAPAP